MSNSNLKEKIDQLDQVKYSTSNVDEMKRVLFMSRKMTVKKSDLQKIFAFIITKLLLVKNPSDLFQGYVAGEDKYIVEEYIPNKIIKIAHLKDNVIYRTEYQYIDFLGMSKLKYTTSLKREERIYGAGDYLAKYYWRRNARDKARFFIRNIKLLIKDKLIIEEN